jgi:hypothetical protein
MTPSGKYLKLFFCNFSKNFFSEIMFVSHFPEVLLCLEQRRAQRERSRANLLPAFIAKSEMETGKKWLEHTKKKMKQEVREKIFKGLLWRMKGGPLERFPEREKKIFYNYNIVPGPALNTDMSSIYTMYSIYLHYVLVP